MFKIILLKLIAIYQIRRDPVAYARYLGVEIGERCRLIGIRAGSGTFGSEPYLISLGDHVTVCGAVQFVTHDGGVWIFRDTRPGINVYGRIRVGNNVFLGFGSTLMPGITIGDNVVIGAGAVVTKDIPSNSIAVGAPAKVIRSIEEYYESILPILDDRIFENDADKRDYLLAKFARKTKEN